MRKFLILWETNPEGIKMYYMQTDDVEIIKKLEYCHGKLIGHNLEDSQDWVVKLTDSLTAIYTSDKPVPVRISGEYTLIHTGIML